MVALPVIVSSVISYQIPNCSASHDHALPAVSKGDDEPGAELFVLLQPLLSCTEQQYIIFRKERIGHEVYDILFKVNTCIHLSDDRT